MAVAGRNVAATAEPAKNEEVEALRQTVEQQGKMLYILVSLVFFVLVIGMGSREKSYQSWIWENMVYPCWRWTPMGALQEYWGSVASLSSSTFAWWWNPELAGGAHIARVTMGSAVFTATSKLGYSGAKWAAKRALGDKAALAGCLIQGMVGDGAAPLNQSTPQRHRRHPEVEYRRGGELQTWHAARKRLRSLCWTPRDHQS